MRKYLAPTLAASLTAIALATFAFAQPGIAINKDTSLQGTGSAGSALGVNFTNVQKRIGNSCAVGSSIRAIDSLGNVTCETDTGPDITGTPTSNRTTVWTNASAVAESAYPCTDASGTMSCGNAATDEFALTGRLSVTTDLDSVVLSATAGSGSRNIWLGDNKVTVGTAEKCIAIGHGALASNIDADHIVAIGDSALANYVGNGAGFGDSVVIGARAAQFTTTAADLVYVGYRAGEQTTTGAVNTIIGSEAFLANTTGSSNTCVGGGCLLSNTIGSENVAVGHVALGANTSGINNVAVGNNALQGNTTGSSNIAIGFEAMKTGITTGSGNIAMGAGALLLSTNCADNIAIGGAALGAATSGGLNTAVGKSALAATTTGTVNVAVGHSALMSNTTASANVALGRDALRDVTTGVFNTGIGDSAGRGITTGTRNTIVGAVQGVEAASKYMVMLADGSGNIVFQCRGGSPVASVGTLQTGSSNCYGTVTGIGANTSVTLTFRDGNGTPANTAYTNRSRCFVQAVGGAQVFTVTQSASAPVVSCFDMAGVAANCVDFSYHCVGQ